MTYKTTEELRALLVDAPPRFSRWRHRKSGIEVLYVTAGLIEDTCTPAAVYQHDGVVWIRPMEEFRERFEPLCLTSE